MPLAHIFGDGELARQPKPLIHRLQVDRDVVDRARERDGPFAQRRLERRPLHTLGQVGDVLVQAATAGRRDQLQHVAKGRGVPVGHALPVGDKVVQAADLRQPDDRPNLAQPVVGADPRVDHLSRRLSTVVADAAARIGERVVVGDHHASLAAGDHLGGEERVGGGLPVPPGPLAINLRPVGVGGVLHQWDPPRPAPVGDCRHLGAHDPANVHDHDGARVLRHAGLDLIERHPQRGGVGVQEHGVAPCDDDGVGGGDEGVRRHQHVLTLDVERLQDDLERRPAAGAPYGMLDAAVIGPELFEGPDVLAAGHDAALEALVDGLQYLLPVLFLEDHPDRRDADRRSIGRQ